MKRSGFKSKLPPRRQAKQIDGYTPRPRPVAVAVAGPAAAVVQVPKARPIQHQSYMDAVRKLPCIRCGITGFTQFCHADEGKGMGLKTDCRLGWPGCGPHDGMPGCHWWVGTSGSMPREERREFERLAGNATRAAIRFVGLWPATLPPWPEDASG